MTNPDHDDVCPLCGNRGQPPEEDVPDGTRMPCALLRERIEEILRSLRGPSDLPATTRRAVWLRLFELAESLDCPNRGASEHRRGASHHSK
ncbi:hypothetical protein [Azospirillum palustre]